MKLITCIAPATLSIVFFWLMNDGIPRFIDYRGLNVSIDSGFSMFIGTFGIAMGFLGTCILLAVQYASPSIPEPISTKKPAPKRTVTQVLESIEKTQQNIASMIYDIRKEAQK